MIEHDAIIEKFVGETGLVGLFIPFMAGPEHVKRAVDAAQALLRATGHGDPEGPWAPLGAGSRRLCVRRMVEGRIDDFAALGDRRRRRPPRVARCDRRSPGDGSCRRAAGLVDDGLDGDTSC